MADLFLGLVIDKLIDICYVYLKDQYRWQTGMKELIKKLLESYPKIEAVLSYANQPDIIDKNQALNKWRWQLRDAIDEADDLLDDFEYMRLEKQLANNTEEETNMRSFKSLLSATSHQLGKVGKRALKIDPILKRLEEVVQKLDRVSSDVTLFFHLIDRAQLEQQKQLDDLNKNRETGSLPTDDLIGRVDDKEFVMQWLKREPSNEEHPTHVSGKTVMYNNISILSLVGDGGLGKTALLQHVYKDEMTNEFDLKMWVCVSNNFDVKKVIAGMLKSLNKQERDSETLETLQSKLQSEVKSKKFLLVLDDIWEENDVNEISNWQKVFSPLSHGRLGSKILITTRMDSTAFMFAKVIDKEKEVKRLEGLKEDKCLELLTTHAFAGVDQNVGDHKKLRCIAVELVKKLYGSPLAAKVMGSVLNSDLDEKHWRIVLNSNLGQNGIFPILKLSYISLPKHLQNCFSFCSIFSQDYEFDKDDLVRMWIAVGFVRPSKTLEETLEDIGQRYFDALVNKSFFDRVDSYYKMHDLLHDLATNVSEQECFRDEGDKELLLTIPETIRHLSIKSCSLKVLKNLRRFKNLRTLRITDFDNYYHDNADNTLNEIFKVTRSIRLLELQPWFYEIYKLKAIKYLKHLRFLRCEFPISRLPRYLTKLYHLQFIICYLDFSSDCDKDDFFPRDMNNLSNLRYMSDTDKLKIFGIGKLKFLQKVEGFYVENDIGYRIEELKHMNDLCILGINQLENMRDATEACNAKLCDKKKLTNLSLNWRDSNYNRQNIVNLDLDERVFDKLQPHNYLKQLHIINYMGVRSAVWMNETHLIHNLEEIKLSNCLEWQILPPFGHLPFLKILRLENMPKVKRLHNKFPGKDKFCHFPLLEKLRISKLEALEDLFDAEVNSWFPCLTELKLYDSPSLQELPNLPPKLKTLKIDNIRWKTLNCCCISTVSLAHDKLCSLTNLERIELGNCLECKILPPFGRLPFLKILRLQNMPKVKRVDNDMYCDFPSLVELHIFKLKALEDWFDARVDCLFPRLTQLKLNYCPNLQELPYLPPKLETLNIDTIGWKTLNCCSISKSIPLKELFVGRCENITFISMVDEIGTLAMLQKVEIQDCPNLISLRGLDNQEVEATRNCQLIIDSLIISKSSVLQMELLRSVTSVRELKIQNEYKLISFPSEAEWCSRQVSSSIRRLQFKGLSSLRSLPSILTRFSSLEILQVFGLSQLQELPEIPASLESLEMYNLTSLQCLPSSLSTMSSLKHLELKSIPLKSLLDLPTSMKRLELCWLELECLPSSLSTISSLNHLKLENIPLLKSLPELPPSLCTLYLNSLDKLECLPSCLPSLSSLTTLHIYRVPLLRELPNLPPSLQSLDIRKCHPKLEKRYDLFRREKR